MRDWLLRRLSGLHERYRRSLATSAASLLERGMFLLVQLIAIPLTLPYLGQERFGAWMVLMAFITVLSVADFGMQYGLQNMISTSFGLDRQKEIKAQVSAGYLVFGLLGGVILLLAWMVVPNLDIQKLVGLSDTTHVDEIRGGIRVLVVVFGLMQPLGIGRIVFVAHQKGYIATSWGILKNTVAFILVIVLSRREASVAELVAAIYGVSALTAICVNLHAWFHFPEIRPVFRKGTLRQGGDVVRSGYKFWILQLLSMIANNLDAIIVAQTMNAAAVAVYSITTKLFRPIVLLQNILTRPLWPAYTEAKAKGDWVWIRKTFWRVLCGTTLFSIVLAAPLLLFGQDIIAWWSRTGLRPDWPLISGVFAYIIVLGIKNPLVVFLNGLNRLNLQMVYQTIYTALSFLLKIYLGTRYGAAGVVWGAVAANLFGLIWMQILESLYVMNYHDRVKLT